ncbi:MAG: hypothetical protein DSY59_04600 [Persephonella sp.]|nr:MAG: hypothetical protein DSY60_02955 [Persephonella sp.]RUM59374.1 MAG: hypothetical protein DSY59_04600 [Persephonella sp.]
MKKYIILFFSFLIILLVLFWVYRLIFSPERLNIIGRTVETTFGLDNGVVEIYSEGKLIKRFLKVEKLTTAYGTYKNEVRPYRFGYGYIDKNLDGILNRNEKRLGKVYFEIPVYSTYIFYDAKETIEE